MSIFWIDMYLLPGLLCTSSEAYNKTAHIRRFVWAFGVGIYNKYKHLIIKPR